MATCFDFGGVGQMMVQLIRYVVVVVVVVEEN